MGLPTIWDRVGCRNTARIALGAKVMVLGRVRGQGSGCVSQV